MVYVQGTTVLIASSSEELYKIFEKGSESRHVASTSELSYISIGVIALVSSGRFWKGDSEIFCRVET